MTIVNGKKGCKILASLNSMQQKWGRLDMMEFVELTSHSYLPTVLRDNDVVFVALQPKLVISFTFES